jgi:PAS domain S-box-containing protein
VIKNLSKAQILRIIESLPVDIIFADENGRVKFWNKNSTRIFTKSAEVLGSDVIKCHSEKSAANVKQLLSDFANGKKESLEYRLQLNGKTINVKYVAVRDGNGKYLGVVEIDQDITNILKVKGKKSY